MRPKFLREMAFIWIITWIIYLVGCHFRNETTLGLTANGTIAFGDDLINFWSAPRLALLGRLNEIYDFSKYHAFQTSIVQGPLRPYHYSYPPVMTLLTLPLGFLPYLWALVAWLGGGFLVFALAIRKAWLANGWTKQNAIIYALAVPAVFINMICGQNATWIAGLLGGGLMLLETRPALGGGLLGFLIFKPHFALLVPIALLAEKKWKALFAFSTVALALIALSILFFGIDNWLDYAQRLEKIRKHVLEDGPNAWFYFLSVFATVRYLPAPVSIAYIAQGLATLGAFMLVAYVWHSTASRRSKNAVLIMAIFFATPYAMVYDLVVTAFIPLWLMFDLTRPQRLRDLAAYTILMLIPLFELAVAPAIGFGPAGAILLFPMLVITAKFALREAHARQLSARHGNI